MSRTIINSKDYPLSEIDPGWAWQAWTPSNDEPWNLQRVGLLHRRAGFGVDTVAAQAAMMRTPEWCIEEQLVGNSQSKDSRAGFETESATILRSVVTSKDSHKLAAWWLHRLLHTPSPTIEKMALFWHGHFATGAEKVLDAELMYQQNRIFRELALGNFRDLVQAVAKDPAMLIYLDSASNRKAHPNENFARELMELFCLGEGNYSEADVQQLSRCFTGWEIRRKQFRFNSGQHDASTKTIFDNKRIQSGEEAIDCVVNHPAMPEFVIRKLFHFFLSDEDIPDRRLLEPLIQLFHDTSFSIEPLIRRILASRLLLSGWSVGRKIRSPVEMVVGWMRMLGCTTNFEFLEDRLKHLGQALFYPPNVKGWDGGRAWINSSTLVGRVNLLNDILSHENSRFYGGNLQQLGTRQKWQSADDVRRMFEELFFIQSLSATETGYLLQIDRDVSNENRFQRALLFLSSLPIMHLS